MPLHRIHPSMLLKAKTQQKVAKQNAAATAAAALDDSQHSISISDAWSDLEEQDEEVERQMKRADKAAQADAETIDKAARDTAEDLKKRKQVHFSKVFSTLEREDDEIQASLQTTDNLQDYSRLSNIQDESMAALSRQQDHADHQPKPARPLLKHSD